MSYQYVKVLIANRVGIIEFNHTRKLNALSKVFIDDLMQALHDLNHTDIRCIILRALKVQRCFLPDMIFVSYQLAAAIHFHTMIHFAKLLG